jgi:hypothetical protein
MCGQCGHIIAAQVLHVFVVSRRVFFDKIQVKLRAGRGIFLLKKAQREGLEQGHVPIDAHLQKYVGQGGGHAE